MIPASPSSVAFFITCDRTFKTLTYSSYVYYFKQLLTLSGFDADKYLGHSFRWGGVATAFKAGVAPDLICMHRDWHSDPIFKIFNSRYEPTVSFQKFCRLYQFMIAHWHTIENLQTTHRFRVWRVWWALLRNNYHNVIIFCTHATCRHNIF